MSSCTPRRMMRPSECDGVLMKIGILKCDQVNDLFAAKYGQYPEMFANLLRPAQPDIEFIVFDAEQRDLPTDIDVADAYLITGSRHGVNDGADWINNLERFVRILHAARKKIVGICFGHQLIAKALGGEVIKSPKGWGIGITQNEIIHEKEWMSPFQPQIKLLVSHQDQVVETPAHAQVIAGSDFCPNYMMQIGTHILTIQGHPEFTKPYAYDLMKSREKIINKQTVEQGIQSLELSEDDFLIAQWIINFLR